MFDASMEHVRLGGMILAPRANKPYDLPALRGGEPYANGSLRRWA